MTIDRFLSDIVVRMRDGMGALWRQIPLILDNPRAYQREAMLLALMGVLILIFFILLVYSVYDAVDTAATKRKMGLHVKKRGKVRRFLVIVAILSVTAFLLTVLPMVKPVSVAVCGSCHTVQSAVASWKSGDHHNVSCYGCHASPGVLGASAASVNGVSRQLARTTNSRSAASRDRTVVNSASCLRCHGDLKKGTIGKRVRMRHSDVINVGMPCLQCHGGVGHAAKTSSAGDASFDRVGAGRSTMSVCLTCHDGTKASSKCDVCHGSHPLNKSGAGFASAKTPAPITCKGCHRPEIEKKCIDCHGVELPHSVQFLMEHAGRSWKDPALCARCHESASPSIGCGCHSEQNEHGSYSAWFPRHGPAAVSVGRYGCNCHEVRFCMKCHTTNPFLGTFNPGQDASFGATPTAPTGGVQSGTPGSNLIIAPQ